MEAVSRPYRWKEVNIKGAECSSGEKCRSGVEKGRVVVADASEAAFLLEG